MGKAAAAAVGAAITGVAAFAGLSGLLPVAWAEGAALLLTGGALVGASFMVGGNKKDVAPTASAPVLSVLARPQEA